jgi:hypothetical protein
MRIARLVSHLLVEPVLDLGLVAGTAGTMKGLA